jgi:hypothetical protein
MEVRRMIKKNVMRIIGLVKKIGAKPFFSNKIIKPPLFVDTIGDNDDTFDGNEEFQLEAVIPIEKRKMSEKMKEAAKKLKDKALHVRIKLKGVISSVVIGEKLKKVEDLEIHTGEKEEDFIWVDGMKYYISHLVYKMINKVPRYVAFLQKRPVEWRLVHVVKYVE